MGKTLEGRGHGPRKAPVKVTAVTTTFGRVGYVSKREPCVAYRVVHPATGTQAVCYSRFGEGLTLVNGMKQWQIGNTLGDASAPGHILFPVAACFDPLTGDIIVAESGNSRVQQLSAATGAHRRFIGGIGVIVTGPRGVDATSSLIAVCEESRIHVFINVSGSVLYSFGTNTTSTSTSCDAIALSFDNCHVFVVDRAKHQVVTFTVAGKFVKAIRFPRSPPCNIQRVSDTMFEVTFVDKFKLGISASRLVG